MNFQDVICCRRASGKKIVPHKMTARNLAEEFPACQRDSFLKSIAAEVLSCTASKKGKGTFDVVLSDTVLFAEGGGQPCDRGTVGGFACTGVREGATKRGSVHEVAGALEPGSRVEVVVDWPLRFDRMQQHTGQHVLTAVAAESAGLRTVGWALYADRAVVELESSGPPSQEVLDRIEARANEAIRQHLAVSVSVVDAADVPASIRSRGAVPKDGAIRIVTVEGVDAATCCGTHLSNTAELQAIKLIGTERSRQGATRVVFLVGGRVLGAVASSIARDRDVSKVLSCAPDEFVARVASLSEENSALAKQRKRLMLDLAAVDAAELVRQAKSTSPPAKLIHGIRCSVSAEYHEAVAAAVAAECPDALLVLLGADGPVAEGKGTFLIIGSTDQAVSAACAISKEVLVGKGGGKGKKVQGKVEKIERRAELMARITSAGLF